jgi:molecular chaperone DnaJ
VLGGGIDIATLEGEVTLKIPSGTRSGHTFVLKGKGAQRFQNSGRGNHRVTVQVDVPQKIDRKDKKILEELKSLGM